MPDKVKIYHVSGDVAEVYQGGARETVQQHPEEWSYEPWPKVRSAADAFREGVAKPQETETETTGETSDAPRSAADAVREGAKTVPVEIPENWEGLPFLKLKGIAQHIIGKQDPTMKKAEAVQIIKDYLAAQ